MKACFRSILGRKAHFRVQTLVSFTILRIAQIKSKGIFN